MMSTLSPFGPRGPSAPGSPGEPLGPSNPSGPGNPGFPGDPSGPMGPGVPCNYKTNIIVLHAVILLFLWRLYTSGTLCTSTTALWICGELT